MTTKEFEEEKELALSYVRQANVDHFVTNCPYSMDDVVLFVNRTIDNMKSELNAEHTEDKQAIAIAIENLEKNKNNLTSPVIFFKTNAIKDLFDDITKYQNDHVKYAEMLISEAIFGADDFPGDYRIWLEE